MTQPRPGRHLLVASTGGHLAQLVKWSKAIGSTGDSLWVTFRSPQSESLLRNRRVLYVPYVAPRDVTRTVSAFFRMARDIDWETEAFTAAVSTGAAVGVAGLAAARLHRVPATYIESISRVNGPSLSGRIVSLDRSISTYCQYQHWAGGRWKFLGSLFEDFHRIDRIRTNRPRLFVTLGTIRPYRFDSAVDAILDTGLADSETVWQVGATTRSSLPGRVVQQLSASEFERCAKEADVVVTHAGVGTIMQLLDMGIYPVIVPRRAHRKEHVDDHQCEIAHLLDRSHIALVCEVDQINRDVILTASGYAIAPLTAD